MKYIKIKNSGCIDPQALHLVGASTKVGDSSKIGQFGSGNKYALAYFLRKNYNVIIYSGLKEITIHTVAEAFRDKTFSVIYINNERTSITTDMGKDWQYWQALRELYCNAIDEGGYAIEFVQEPKPCENETHFYINIDSDIKKFITNFDNYFCTNKKVLFECATGRIVEKSGKLANIYRKGIRCFKTETVSMYDYDFNDIQIDENRLVSYHWKVPELIWDLICQCDNEEIILNILHNAGNYKFIEGCMHDFAHIHLGAMSETFKKVIKENKFAPTGWAGLLSTEEQQSHILIPTEIFKAVRGTLKDENVGDKFKVSAKGDLFRVITDNKLYEATLKQAMYFFQECNFEIPYEIKIARFDTKDTLGGVDKLDDVYYIILSDICLEKGVNEVVNTIIEEYVHIKHGVRDTTRSMQTALIDELISYMKKANSIII